MENEELKKLEEERLIGGIPQIPIYNCQHCYCGRLTVNKKEHLVCCMCGHRTLVNPIG